MPPAFGDTRSLVVLVVEDDPQTRELYRTALREAGGYAVVAVEDGLDALRYLETESPAAVVLDLGLPRVPGGDVLGDMAARGLTDQVPVIVVTGSTPARLNERDFACVLRKPIAPDELVEAVRKCLASRPRRR
jgi:DNA-binding response OmpR family regulator